LPALPRVELRVHRDEPILLHWYAHKDGEFVRGITRVETEGDRLSRVRNYFYTPDVLAEICRELGVPSASTGIATSPTAARSRIPAPPYCSFPSRSSRQRSSWLTVSCLRMPSRAGS